jgi:uncharacterized integral membrane protein
LGRNGFLYTVIITLGYYGGRMLMYWAAILLAILTLFTGCLVYMFVNMQFRMRWLSDNITRKLREEIAQIYLGHTVVHIGDWMEFINKERRQAEEERKKDFKQALNKMARIRLSEIDDRWKTEIPSYVFILIATIIGVVLLFIN